jgi:heptosyltransferase-3
MTQISPPASGKYPGYWTIKKLRRGLRDALSAWLARGNEVPPALHPLDPSTLRRVIVCRRNNRLGNMLFLTPLLRSLADTLPQAEIDVLIGSADYAELFRGLPGLCQVWVMPSRGWAWPLRMLILLFRLRARRYDLAIEPALNSFSNRLSAHLCAARWYLGFHAPGQWLSLTQAVVHDPAVIIHEALMPLQLLRAGFAPGTARLHDRLALALTAEERAAGQAQLAAALGAQGQGPVIGFFTEATGHKRLPVEWWQAWLGGLRESGQAFRLLQLLPPGTMPSLEPGLPQLREPDHRRLAAILGGLDLFVSCDAGPIHLAAAAGAPTLGLFHATSSAYYRPLGEKTLALEVKALTPAQVAESALSHLSRLPR